MAVKSTSRTAMAPMTTFARRDRVGTDTGGRMATRVSFSRGRDAGTTDGAGSGRPGRLGPGPRAPTRSPRPTLGTVPGSPAACSGRQLPPPGGAGVAGASSAGLRGPSGAEVLERGQRLVEVGHPGEGEARLRGGGGVDAVVGRDEEELGAD